MGARRQQVPRTIKASHMRNDRLSAKNVHVKSGLCYEKTRKRCFIPTRPGPTERGSNCSLTSLAPLQLLELLRGTVTASFRVLPHRRRARRVGSHRDASRENHRCRRGAWRTRGRCGRQRASPDASASPPTCGALVSQYAAASLRLLRTLPQPPQRTRTRAGVDREAQLEQEAAAQEQALVPPGALRVCVCACGGGATG